jgi:hypothetical protein
MTGVHKQPSLTLASSRQLAQVTCLAFFVACEFHVSAKLRLMQFMVNHRSRHERNAARKPIKEFYANQKSSHPLELANNGFEIARGDLMFSRFRTAQICHNYAFSARFYTIMTIIATSKSKG